jgi:hypothetical protein
MQPIQRSQPEVLGQAAAIKPKASLVQIAFRCSFQFFYEPHDMNTSIHVRKQVEGGRTC